MDPDSGALLRKVLKKRWLAILVIFVGLIGYVCAGLLLVPNLGCKETREAYEPFFTAAGALTAGIFVTLAVASREITSSVLLGIITVAFVGTSALGAVLALLPDASPFLYNVAFIALVGGGIASLVSTALIAAASLIQARAERQAEILDALQKLLHK